jgi:hypothetical protein
VAQQLVASGLHLPSNSGFLFFCFVFADKQQTISPETSLCEDLFHAFWLT